MLPCRFLFLFLSVSFGAFAQQEAEPEPSVVESVPQKARLEVLQLVGEQMVAIPPEDFQGVDVCELYVPGDSVELLERLEVYLHWPINDETLEAITQAIYAYYEEEGESIIEVSPYAIDSKRGVLQLLVRMESPPAVLPEEEGVRLEVLQVVTVEMVALPEESFKGIDVSELEIASGEELKRRLQKFLERPITEKRLQRMREVIWSYLEETGVMLDELVQVQVDPDEGILQVVVKIRKEEPTIEAESLPAVDENQARVDE